LGIHAFDMMDERKILLEEIMDVMNYPDIIVKRGYQYFYLKKLNRGSLRLCCEKTENIIKVITLYWY